MKAIEPHFHTVLWPVVFNCWVKVVFKQLFTANFEIQKCWMDNKICKTELSIDTGANILKSTFIVLKESSRSDTYFISYFCTEF